MTAEGLPGVSWRGETWFSWEIIHLNAKELMNCPENVWSKMTSSNEVSRSVKQAPKPGKRRKEAPVTPPLRTHHQHRFAGKRDVGSRVIHASDTRSWPGFGSLTPHLGPNEAFELDNRCESRWGWSRVRWGLKGRHFCCPFSVGCVSY